MKQKTNLHSPRDSAISRICEDEWCEPEISLNRLRYNLVGTLVIS